MKIRLILPFIIGILFIGTAAAPFLSTNVTSKDFGLEFEETVDIQGIGVVTRTLEDDQYTLNVSTNLENSEEGFYTVWLISLTPFWHMNIGTLENGELIYTHDATTMDYKAFTEIIITLESTPDAEIPHDYHVVETSFTE